MKIVVHIAVLVFLLTALGCETEIPVDREQDEESKISFLIAEAVYDQNSSVGQCTQSADYAMVILNEPSGLKTYYLSISDSTGQFLTDEITLHSGTYLLEEFIVFEESGVAGDRSDDRMVSAAAHEDSEFGKKADQTVSFSFHAPEGEQTTVPVSVFCNDPLKYKWWWYWYGFVEFYPQIVVVKEALFYGDFCSEEFMSYAGSKYGSYPKIDMPAIFQISVWTDQDGNGSYETHLIDANNEDDYQSNENQSGVPPLSLNFADEPDETDYYRLDVSIYELVGIDPQSGEPVFDYKYFDSWFFEDEAEIVYSDESYRWNPDGVESFGTGSDGIFDFIVGPCTVIDWDVDLDDPDFESGPGSETAYAKATSGSVCFLETGFSRWGWTNQMSNSPDTIYELPIWAGAGQCDTDKGILVGSISIEIQADNQAVVRFQLDNSFGLEETHLYVGTEPYPVSNGFYTVASGQFPFLHDDLNQSSSDSYDLTLPEGRFFLIAHAVVHSIQ